MRASCFLLTLLLCGQAWAQYAIEVVNIENPAVQAYMADSTYYYNDSIDFTVVTQYTDKEQYGTRLDRPNGKEVTWTLVSPPDSIAEIRITLSERQDFHDSTTYFPDRITIGAYTIYNLFPNCKYYYKVEEYSFDGIARLLAKGEFLTIGQVRMMQISGARNVRDLGGWPTQFGVPLRYGILYRSGHLDKVKPDGYHHFVENMGVSAELDLRGLFSKEPHLRASLLGDNIDFNRIVTDSYGLKSDTQREIYAKDLTWIIRRLREGKVVDWHCGVGCDRCGTVSFLIEGVLGVSETDLCRDYELSCFAGHKRYRGHVGFRKMLPFIKQQGPEDDLAQCFYNYLVESGVSADDLDYLRFVMLDY